MGPNFENNVNKLPFLANTRGGLFAGATAGSGVGASASLAGDLQNGGSFGVGQAEAHAGGVQKEVIKTVSTNGETNVESNADQTVGSTPEVAPVNTYLPILPETNPTDVQTEQNVQQEINPQHESNIQPETNNQTETIAQPEPSVQPEINEQSENNEATLQPESNAQPDQSESNNQSESVAQREQIALPETSTQSIIPSTSSLAPETTVNNPSWCNSVVSHTVLTNMNAHNN